VSKLNANKTATAGDIVREMGIYNLFTRGLMLRIIMIGTLTGLQVRAPEGGGAGGGGAAAAVACAMLADGLLLCAAARSLPHAHPHCCSVTCVCVCVLRLRRARARPQWGIYDAFKVAAGLPTTGAKTPTPEPAASK
jgi:hypothetical protein